VRDVASSTWAAAENRCYGREGASLCSHEQMRRACSHRGAVVSPLAGVGWLSSRTADDEAVIVNTTASDVAACDNFDGTSPALGTNQPAAYCCLEWMRY
jgi:hypothetical protein